MHPLPIRAANPVKGNLADPRIEAFKIQKTAFASPFMKFCFLPLLLMITAFQIFAADPVLKFTVTKADGRPATYEFLTPGNETNQGATLSGDNSAAEQHRAGVAALIWAKQFYGAHEIYLRSVELKETGPVPYYLATFDGELGGARQVFFAVVLASGSVVQPVETR